MEKYTKKYERELFTGERALFKSSDIYVSECVFSDGESPLKECRGIEVKNSLFKWRYPIWYSKDIYCESSVFFKDSRAGMWYSDNIRLKDCEIESPKNIRRCKDVYLKNVSIPGGEETLWDCKDVKLEDVNSVGNYFAMNSENIDIERLTLHGKYSFDGVKNVVIRDSRLITKDAFWNSENVTVYDSFITSEYIGWNAKNLTFVNCTIESLQGFCYIDNLVLKNCKLINTTLAFEYSTVNVEVVGEINSVTNPKGGVIIADSIGELIMEPDKIDPDKTVIICRNKEGVNND